MPRSCRLLLHTVDRGLERRVRRAVPDECVLQVTSAWEDLDRLVGGAECVVVAWQNPMPADVGRLRLLRDRHPAQALVVVAPETALNVRRLVGVALDSVVWADRLEHELWPGVRRACAATLLAKLARAIEGAPCIPPRLRDALATAVRSDPPLGSVAALARAVHCHRATLAEQWRGAVRGDAAMRLQDFLGWLLLLHAARRKRADLKWGAVAGECAVHVHTLRRTAHRLAGLRLVEMEGSGQHLLLERFRDRCVAVLARAGVSVPRAVLPPAPLASPVGLRWDDELLLEATDCPSR